MIILGVVLLIIAFGAVVLWGMRVALSRPAQPVESVGST